MYKTFNFKQYLKQRYDFEYRDLTDAEYRIYEILCFSDFYDNYESWLTQKTIAELVRKSDRQVRNILYSLQQKGFIIIEKVRKYANNKTRNVYKLLRKRLYDKFVHNLSTNTGNDIGNSFLSKSDNKIIDDIIAKKEKNYGKDIVEKALEKVKKYKNNFNFKGFDIYLTKVIESILKQTKNKNQYIGNRGKFFQGRKSQPSTFNDFKQRGYDFDKLERLLLGKDKTLTLRDCML